MKNIASQVSFSTGSGGGEHAFEARLADRLIGMPGHIATFEITRYVNAAFTDVLLSITQTLAEMGHTAVVQLFSGRSALLDVVGHAVFAVSSRDVRHGDADEVTDRTLNITGHGDAGMVEAVAAVLEKTLVENPMPRVRWEFLTNKLRDRRAVHIRHPNPVCSAFYPWLGDVDNYLKRYVESDSAVLILLGETGTAKTSLLRHMIWTHSLNTVFTYEDELLNSDGLFADFITGDDHLLVVEDADVFLTDREHGGNHVMSKFLNISDGLAGGEQRKKIVFTANILDPARLDSALLRPGRCFDCQVFRRLSYEEAVLAAEAAGLGIVLARKDYTLAELFALGRAEPVVRVTRAGFNG